jgi:hypothetical protein
VVVVRDALVWWIGFVPAVMTYPGGKLMVADAVLVYVPARHDSATTVAAPALSIAGSSSVFTVTPLRNRVSWRRISGTLLLQRTSARPSTEPAALTKKGVPAEITQLIVSSPQLAGFIAAPGFTAHGSMSWGPMPVAAWALGWAVMVILWPPGWAAGAAA